MIFSEYIESLASSHKDIMHSKKKCHFTDLNEDAQSGYAHMNMHYPCVVLEETDCSFSGEIELDHHILLFLDHVKDTGNAKEIRDVFKNMKKVALDFLKKMNRDKRQGVAPVQRFSIDETEMGRVFLKDAGLYGYAVSLNHMVPFVDIDCNDAFIDGSQTFTTG